MRPEEFTAVRPSIAIVANRDRTSKTIVKQMTDLIGDRATIRGFSQEMGLPPWSNFCYVLAATYELANSIASNIPRDVSLVVMQRTIWKEHWKKVLSIPVGAKALLVNDQYFTAIEQVPDKLVMLRNRNIMLRKSALGNDERDWLGIIVLRELSKTESHEIEVYGGAILAGYVANYRFDNIIGNGQTIRQVMDKARNFAGSDFSILIEGESGTGKEIFAQAIHNTSPRQRKPFVALNCAAVPENLLESELFGYEEGSFTGARKGGKKGLFEQANGGTIFLDEIGDLSLNLQARLLRVLQEKVVMRIGATKLHPIDVRIISATNRDLAKMTKEGRFREDLYYRLGVLPLDIPALRERREDILPLVFHFVDKIHSTNKNKLRTLLSEAADVLEALQNYDWPGNVRELENCINKLSFRRLVMLNKGRGGTKLL